MNHLSIIYVKIQTKVYYCGLYSIFLVFFV